MEYVSKYSDVFLAIFVVLVVGMMIIPLPTPLLDILLTLNITFAITILLVVLYITHAIRLTSFPSILLIATLFRLALNVSTTRLILLNADAGNIIDAFGAFVVRGNMIVGAIVFLILTLVNFIVVSKGSERVAEVSARFTLDAMPGKQMAIDADIRAGAIDLQEAKERRRQLSRESQLFGAMDGAMKFVKGDAIAGILITCVNIIGGVAVGVLLKNLNAGNALKIYGLLTIGDGLLSQIPALIVSVAAGLMVTRVEPECSGDHLGRDISLQMLSYPKALIIVSGLLFCLGIVPGLPILPFWTMGFLILGSALYLVKVSDSKEYLHAINDGSEKNNTNNETTSFLSVPAPLTINLGCYVTKLVDAETPDCEFFTTVLPLMRKEIYIETGVHIPGIKISGSREELPEDVFTIHILDTPVYTGYMPRDQAYIKDADEKILLIAGGNKTSTKPAFDDKGTLVPIDRKHYLEDAGYNVYSGISLFTYQVKTILLNHLYEFIGLQEVKWLCDELEHIYPDTVGESVPRIISYQRLGDILRRLVQEGVCIRDLKRILEAVSEYADIEPDNIALTEKVRMKLARQIYHQFSTKGKLEVYLLDPQLEDVFRAAIHVSGQERILALTPDVMDRVITAFQTQLRQTINSGTAVILTVEQNIRYVLWRFLNQQMQGIRVLAAQEMPPGAHFTALGSISMQC
jgi:type III secretion protein V